MTKPFDLAVLTEQLKEIGLPMTEVLAEKVFGVTCDWLNASAEVHPNVIVKTAVPLAVATIKPIVAHELNKIDADKEN
jgi:hypothetical protein